MNNRMRNVQKLLKLRAKELPCLEIPYPDAFKIVEADASELGYGGILKQELGGKITVVRFIWNLETSAKELCNCEK